MKISFIVVGQVQGVMYRKSFCMCAKSRGLLAGATNLEDRTRVHCSLEGYEEDIENFLLELTSAKSINSWGAKVDFIERLSEYKDLSDHDYDNCELDGSLSLGGVKLLI